MNHKIKIQNYFPQPIQPVRNGAAQDVNPKRQERFEALLHQEIQQQKKTVHISHHAFVRLQSRGIELTQDLMNRLEKAVDKAEAKGARESLILVDEIAFVVSVRNRTVITAMDEASMKEHVFTNIDSAVLM